ncbi:MAG TPA: ATP-binding protein [bacterium]|nr:ATP-binding protein [bacterium]
MSEQKFSMIAEGQSIFGKGLPILESEFHEKVGGFWDLTDLDKIRFRFKLLQNPTFGRVADHPLNDLTYSVINKIIQRLKYGQIIISLIGDTGSGKSRVAQQIAQQFINPYIPIEGQLEINKIIFNYEAFLDLCGKLSQKSIVILDEQIQSSGIGSEREQKEFINIQEVTRKFGLNMIFCSPTPRPNDTAHIQLEVVCRSQRERKTKLAVKYQDIYLGYMVVDIPEDKDDPLWVEYDKDDGKKDEFIEEIRKRNVGRLDYDILFDKLREHEFYEYCETKTDIITLSSVVFPQLTSQEHTSLSNWIYMKARMEGMMQKKKSKKQEDFSE